APSASFSGNAHDLVMGDAAIVVNHHRLHLGEDNRCVDIDARERLDRGQRSPQRNDLKLGAGRELAPQYGCANKSGKRGELRKRFALEMSDIAIGKFPLRDSLPVSRDHGVSIRGCGPSYHSMMMRSMADTGCRSLIASWHPGDFQQSRAA